MNTPASSPSLSPKIQVLSAEVINQIAAGEVVEKPAHLVKELVENSLDAGAKRIVISVDPKSLDIEVEDDGCGISKEDLPVALARHATSKIMNSEDLWSLKSFGFRGEALASISAVSDFSIKSKAKADVESLVEEGARGYLIQSRFGETSEMIETPAAPGTRVSVKDLFGNLPARKKFLRSPQFELGSIRQSVKALAMANPKIEFVFRVGSEKKVEFAYGPCGLDRRVQEIFGIEQVFETSGEMAGYRVRLVFSDPNTTQKSAKNLWIFVQNRWVQDKSIFTAVMEAYRSLLMHGEYPYVAVFLDLPNGEVDVNIHPTKSQVKFADPKLVFQLVMRSLREGLEKAPWLGPLLGHSQNFEKSNFQVERPSVQERVSLKDLQQFRPQPLMPAQFIAEQSIFGPFTAEQSKGDQSKCEHSGSGQAEAPQSFRSSDLFEVPHQTEASMPLGFVQHHDQATASDSRKLAAKPLWSSLQLIGQVGMTYLVCQKPEAVVFIDQHAAHERVLYERIMSAFHTRSPKSQEFLIPLVFDTAPEQIEWIWKHRDSFLKLGLRIEKGGPSQIQVEAAPEWLVDSSVLKMLEEVSKTGVHRGADADFSKYFEPIAATLACHSAVRAGKRMSESEMRRLLEEMDEFSFSSFCPHGRPVYVEYPFAKLERDFARVL